MTDLWDESLAKEALRKVLSKTDSSGVCNEPGEVFDTSDLWLIEQLIDRGFLFEPLGRERVLATGLPILLQLTPSAHDLLNSDKKMQAMKSTVGGTLGSLSKYALLPSAGIIIASIVLYKLGIAQ